MKPKNNGVIYKGVFIPVWGGLNHNKSPRFLKSGGIENISVAILAENHYASIVVEEEISEEEYEKRYIHKDRNKA